MKQHGLVPDLPDELAADSCDMAQLIRKLLQRDPQQRVAIKDLDVSSCVDWNSY